jgi:hypothetical protein
MQIELLVAGGCPLADEMRKNLTLAVNQLGLTGFEVVSLDALDPDDQRRSYGSPTVLCDSRDLFASSPQGEGQRTYAEGVPSVATFQELLRSRHEEIKQKLEDLR